ncbi:MAG: creatininase family protein [Polyangiaceae bacterium]|nr:creatininase family protein [Myxococcales bacterium]MCB9587179.1 creatininase family protein [Polyangiaceae bacterium]
MTPLPKHVRLADLTYQELERRPKQRLVVVLPVGATEAHGPHLPLGTDVIISEAMAERAITRLAAHDVDALVAPSFAYSVADFAGDFSGTISIRAETATALLVDLGTSLARHGVRYLALANAHLDPTHIGTLYAAREQLGGKLDIIFPDITRKPWALRLSDEFKSGACHAGQYEGSIVMARAPELVREELRLGLPANPSSLSVAIREGKQSFQEAGGPLAYFGRPAEASAAEGEQTIDTLAEILCEAVVARLQGALG